MFEDFLRRLRYDVATFADVMLALLSSPIASGKLVSATMLSGETTVTIKHGLGRAANGALVVSAAGTGVYVVQPTTTTTELTVLAASAPGSNVDIRLWVF